MAIPDNAIEVMAYLILIVNGLVDSLVAPIFDRLKWDKFWLKYAAWAMSGGMAYLTGLNVFATTMPDYPLVGHILTAVFAGVIVGVGANKLHDVTDKPSVTTANYTITGSGGKLSGVVFQPNTTGSNDRD